MVLLASHKFEESLSAAAAGHPPPLSTVPRTAAPLLDLGCRPVGCAADVIRLALLVYWADVMSLVGGGITAKIRAKRTKTGAPRVRRSRGVMLPVRPSTVRPCPSMPRSRSVVWVCRPGAADFLIWPWILSPNQKANPSFSRDKDDLIFRDGCFRPR